MLAIGDCKEISHFGAGTARPGTADVWADEVQNVSGRKPRRKVTTIVVVAQPRAIRRRATGPDLPFSRPSARLDGAGALPDGDPARLLSRVENTHTTSTNRDVAPDALLSEDDAVRPEAQLLTSGIPAALAAYTSALLWPQRFERIRAVDLLAGWPAASKT